MAQSGGGGIGPVDSPNSSNPPAIQVHDLTVRFNGSLALDQVSFEAGPGTLISVVGPNGSGKSTLMRALVGLVTPTHGSVLVNGVSPKKARGQIAYVPQREQINWRFPITVWDVVMQGRIRKIGFFRLPSKVDKQIVHQSLERLAMEGKSSTVVQELSGGQRQRVFVARALAQEANILLLDEAMSGADLVSQDILFEVLTGLRREGRTIMVATHDLTEVVDRYDTCLCLNCRMCGYGPVESTLTADVLQQMYGVPHSHIHHHLPGPGEEGHGHGH